MSMLDGNTNREQDGNPLIAKHNPQGTKSPRMCLAQCRYDAFTKPRQEIFERRIRDRESSSLHGGAQLGDLPLVVAEGLGGAGRAALHAGVPLPRAVAVAAAGHRPPRQGAG